MPNTSNPIKLNSHSHFYCSSDNIRKATISTSSTTVCFYFRILSCWCFFSKYSITSSAKTSVSRLERHHFSTILLPNATPRGWRGCSTTHPNKGYATTACVLDSLLTPPSWEGKELHKEMIWTADKVVMATTTKKAPDEVTLGITSFLVGLSHSQRKAQHHWVHNFSTPLKGYTQSATQALEKKPGSFLST